MCEDKLERFHFRINDITTDEEIVARWQQRVRHSVETLNLWKNTVGGGAQPEAPAQMWLETNMKSVEELSVLLTPRSSTVSEAVLTFEPMPNGVTTSTPPTSPPAQADRDEVADSPNSAPGVVAS